MMLSQDYMSFQAGFGIVLPGLYYVNKAFTITLWLICWMYYSCHRSLWKNQRIWFYNCFRDAMNWLDEYHDDVIKWKHFPRHWSFARGIHPTPVNSPNKGQWRGALMCSLVWINGWGRWFETPSHSLWCHCNVYIPTSALVVIAMKYFAYMYPC